MSFLKKMFSKKDPVEEMRQLFTRQDWAGVLSAAKRLDRIELDDAVLAETGKWEERAGDALAKINLEEGTWAQKSGNLLRAREDYQLAIGQARSVELRKSAEDALIALDRGELPKEKEPEAIESPAIHATAAARQRQVRKLILRKWILMKKPAWSYCWPPCPPNSRSAT